METFGKDGLGYLDGDDGLGHPGGDDGFGHPGGDDGHSSKSNLVPFSLLSR